MATFKEALRIDLKQKRMALSQKEVSLFSQNLTDQIKNDLNYQNSKVVALYLPVNNEVDLRFLLSDQKIFLVPRINEKDELEFVEINEKTEYRANKFRALEPKTGKIWQKIDYMVVPALAIYQNNRLGYGRAYYDTYLKAKRPTYLVGAIYDFQEVFFQPEAHDVPLDYYFKVK